MNPIWKITPFSALVVSGFLLNFTALFTQWWIVLYPDPQDSTYTPIIYIGILPFENVAIWKVFETRYWFRFCVIFILASSAFYIAMVGFLVNAIVYNRREGFKLLTRVAFHRTAVFGGVSSVLGAVGFTLLVSFCPSMSETLIIRAGSSAYMQLAALIIAAVCSALTVLLNLSGYCQSCG